MSANARIPKHCLHRPSGRGYVKLGGQCYYTGPWGSQEGEDAYQRLLGSWLANGRSLPVEAPGAAGEACLVRDLVADYWEFCQTYYCRDGQPTREVERVSFAVRPLLEKFGQCPVQDFGPLKLKAYRGCLVAAGLCRRTVNQRVGVIKRMFRWAASEEKVPGEVAQALRCVDGLRLGRTAAPEGRLVKPVPLADVEAVLPLLSRTVAGMVKVQFLTGMRPGEVVQMRTADLDRSGPVWLYRPRRHKTQHHGHVRVIALGPKAQEVLKPFLKLDQQAFVFSPREADAERRDAAARTRKSKRQPSQVSRSLTARMEARSRVGETYDTASYARAVARACAQAGVTQWSPNQLRHSVADRIRKQFGLDAAKAVLGHSSTQVTEVYAELDQRQAVAIMEQCG